MSFYVEYELRCDCGGDDDPYGCDPAIYGTFQNIAWREAAGAGWTRRGVNGKWKHYKPGHEPAEES